jgi:hypothetical protein
MLTLYYPDFTDIRCAWLIIFKINTF